MTRMDPLLLGKNFARLLEKPIIATRVSATFILHGGLKFRNENEDTSKVTREIGNVTEGKLTRCCAAAISYCKIVVLSVFFRCPDTEVIFEYSIRSNDALEASPDLNALPFQMQIYFTKLDGMRCMRVLSKSQPITRDKQQVASLFNFAVSLSGLFFSPGCSRGAHGVAGRQRRSTECEIRRSWRL